MPAGRPRTSSGRRLRSSACSCCDRPMRRRAQASKPQLAPRVIGFLSLDALPPMDTQPPQREQLPGEYHDDLVFIVAHGALGEIESRPAREALRKIPEGVYWTEPALPAMEVASFWEVARQMYWDERAAADAVALENVKLGSRATTRHLRDESLDEFTRRCRPRISYEQTRLRGMQGNMARSFLRSHLARDRREWVAFVKSLAEPLPAIDDRGSGRSPD